MVTISKRELKIFNVISPSDGGRGSKKALKVRTYFNVWSLIGEGRTENKEL